VLPRREFKGDSTIERCWLGWYAVDDFLSALEPKHLLRNTVPQFLEFTAKNSSHVFLARASDGLNYFCFAPELREIWYYAARKANFFPSVLRNREPSHDPALDTLEVFLIPGDRKNLNEDWVEKWTEPVELAQTVFNRYGGYQLSLHTNDLIQKARNGVLEEALNSSELITAANVAIAKERPPTGRKECAAASRSSRRRTDSRSSFEQQEDEYQRCSSRSEKLKSAKENFQGPGKPPKKGLPKGKGPGKGTSPLRSGNREDGQPEKYQ